MRPQIGLAAAALLVAGCGGRDTAEPATSAPAPATIRVTSAAQIERIAVAQGELVGLVSAD